MFYFKDEDAFKDTKIQPAYSRIMHLITAMDREAIPFGVYDKETQELTIFDEALLPIGHDRKSLQFLLDYRNFHQELVGYSLTFTAAPKK